LQIKVKSEKVKLKWWLVQRCRGVLKCRSSEVLKSKGTEVGAEDRGAEVLKRCKGGTEKMQRRRCCRYRIKGAIEVIQRCRCSEEVKRSSDQC